MKQIGMFLLKVIAYQYLLNRKEQNMNKKLKNQSGITLIALIITIYHFQIFKR